MKEKSVQEPDYEVDVHSVNRVVCIMGFTCSASGLMSSLFDNHPNVLMFPDNVISSFQDFWEENSSLSLDLLLVKFLDKYTTIFDARTTPAGLEGSAETGEARGFTTLGFDRKEFLEVDRSSFKLHMRELIGDIHPVPRKLFFQAMHVSYSKALGRQVKDPIIVFGLHSLGHPGRFEGLMEDFSDVWFLYMVRHPVRATASRLRMQVKSGLVGITSFYRIIHGISTGGLTDLSVPANRWKAIRMEDLHRAPEDNMKNICHWLHLPWNKTLLKSTILGKQWWNQKDSAQISGFNPSISLQSHSEYLSKLDHLRLSVLLGKKTVFWDYSTSWWSKNLIIKLVVLPVAVLPLLVVPFKVELMFWKKMIKDNIAPKMRVLIVGYVLGRVALIRAWLLIFFGLGKEVQLLSLNHNKE